ncbi:MAG TPA: hypothetical protein VGE24_12360 [Emticicia sp.]
MKRIFLIVSLIGLISDTFAQILEKPKVAFCEFGKGCVFYDHPFSYKQLDVMFDYLGNFEAKKGILTFVLEDNAKTNHYPDRKRNPDELHKLFGGKGNPLFVPWSLSIYQNIQPEDGKWKIESEKPQVGNCPKGIDAQLANIKVIESGNKKFSKPFSPEPLLPAKEAKWFPVEPNEYKCILQLTESNTFTTVYDVRITTPRNMEGVMNYTINIPNLPVCRIKVNFKYTKN